SRHGGVAPAAAVRSGQPYAPSPRNFPPASGRTERQARMKRKLLGERLLETGLVREHELAQALQAQQSTGEQLGRLLVRLGYLQEDDLLRMLCEEAGVPFSTLEGVWPEAD